MNILNKIFITIIVVISAASTPLLASVDPYDYYPAQRYKLKDELFKPNDRLLDSNPLRPLVVKDSKGNVYYTDSTGRVMVSVDKDGNRTFSMRGVQSHQRTKGGKLTKKMVRTAGSNIVKTQDEHGRAMGSQKLGKGNKVIAEFDADGNKVRSYKYDKYGKSVEWVIDENTQAKVKYGSNGKPEYEVDHDGDVIARYKYDAAGRLEKKTDAYGNETLFDTRGNMTKTIAKEGYLMATFHYTVDENGYYEMDFVKNEVTGSITYYEDNKQQYEKNFNGLVSKTYKWEGTKLVFSEDKLDGTVTWYDKNRPTHITRNGALEQTWIYDKGKLVGLWNERKSTFALYSRGIHQMTVSYADTNKPTKEELMKLFDKYGIKL